MAELPVIIRTFPQPITGSGGAEAEQPLNRTGYIIFRGELGEQKQIVEVLAGEAAPTPSGGYAKWARVPRPQRKSLTILEGYEPMTLTVPVLFDAVRGNGVREDVENQIQKLEWMAGRGVKYRQPYEAGVGKPPLVVVYSAKGEQRETPLIPKPFQTPNIKWYVDDLTWDEHPLRSPGGARIRQACVVKLVEYVVDALSPGGPRTAAFKTFHTTGSLNTVRKLVAHYLAGSRSRLGEAVSATVKLNGFNRAIGTNPEKKLKSNTAIRIPTKYLHI